MPTPIPTAIPVGATDVDGVPMAAIAEQFGTPCFVYSHSAIVASFEALRDAFADVDHRICYAVKANSNLAILRLLNDLGAGFDIVSGGELTRVLRVGADPANVVFAGVGKSEQEMLQALHAGVGCFNVESAAELELLATVAATAGLVAPVSLRLNPNVDARTHKYISTGLKENKFGIPIEEALALYERAQALPAVQVKGIGAHIGSQIASVGPFIESLEALLSVVDALQERGITVSEIDLGGGLGVRYRDEEVPDLQHYSRALGQRLTGRSLPVVFEPGRSIVANAGVLLTSTQFLKHNGDRHFAVIDAAMNDLLRPALYEAFHEAWTVPVPLSEAEQTANWDLVGPVCESGDWLARNRNLTLARGSLVALGGAGAYGAAMSSNYNSRLRAPEVLCKNGEMRLIRRRETMDDLLATEVDIPAPLAAGDTHRAPAVG